MKINESDTPTLRAHKRLAIRVDEHGGDLSPRETDFVESVVKQLEEGRPLTEKQLKWLEDIDERKVR